MIIKSMSRKSPSFGQLLAYMTIPEHPAPAIAHNLSSDAQDVASVHKEFLDNFRYLPNRKNGNVLYHEILSFSDLDSPNVSLSIVEDLTRKYLDLRAPFALAFAQAHFRKTDCTHVHIMISANNKSSDRRVSLSKAEFAKVKRHLEQYQKDRYPFLEHSVVFDRSSEPKLRQSRKESERDRRLLKEGNRGPSQKEQLRDLVAEQITKANSAKGFRLSLKLLGLQLYRCGIDGKHYGVLDSARDSNTPESGRRYRLSTLGLDGTFEKALRQWEPLPERLIAMAEQDLEGAEQRWLTQDFRQRFQDIVGSYTAERSPLERRRLEQIRAFRGGQRQDDREPPEQSLQRPFG